MPGWITPATSVTEWQRLRNGGHREIGIDQIVDVIAKHGLLQQLINRQRDIPA